MEKPLSESKLTEQIKKCVEDVIEELLGGVIEKVDILTDKVDELKQKVCDLEYEMKKGK